MKNLKKEVGIEAAKYVKEGMILGLGTGSTAKFFVDEVGRRIKEEGLKITTVTTSSVTQKQAESLGIQVLPLDEVDYIDLTVDGADEFDPELNGIKGGGAALLMEKIVADNSRDYIWIADESKKVAQLGAFPLPVEVIQFGAELLFKKFVAKGYKPSWRLNEDGSKKITDQKHFLIDLHLEKIPDAYDLANELDHTVGVVEHGLFLDRAQTVIIAGSNGIETFKRK